MASCAIRNISETSAMINAPLADQADAPDQSDTQLVDALVARAQAAQQRFSRAPAQSRYDNAALAAAWALMEPERNRALANLAVATTGLGKVADKITKNHRKTLGLLRDLQDVRTCGIIREIPEKGLVEIARPVGVVAAVVPSTNPLATSVNNAVNALKCGNAIILSPSPKASEAVAKLVDAVHAEFAKTGIDPDLVQVLPQPSGKGKTQRLIERADLAIVTGSQDNVRRAYASGTPAIGVGVGNAPIIIDETADLDAAAERIATSKTFDNATSCSAESALIVCGAVFEPMMQALHRHGGRLLSAEQTNRLIATLWQDGQLNRRIIAKDIDVVLAQTGLNVTDAPDARFLMAPADGIGANHPLSSEKLSLVVALYHARDFAQAKYIAGKLLDHQGAGHSVGLHTTRAERGIELGLELPTCRVIVNQPHCFATGGSFENGMPFSLSMGCGTWGGNSIDDNLHYRHFMNVTRVVSPIAPRQPSLDDIFSTYWEEAGK
jgi:sulfoacetaldehyde dehydrogenase